MELLALSQLAVKCHAVLGQRNLAKLLALLLRNIFR